MDEYSHSIVQGDSEEFLSLEDNDLPVLEAESNSQQPKKSKHSSESATIDAEIIDMTVLGEYAGIHSVSWPIQDMDCPHCASVAMSALNRLTQVNESIVSATDGLSLIHI